MEIYGLYSPEDELLSIHRTEVGAKENLKQFEKAHGEDFYVDLVTLHE